tara:strand:- start:380 stop:1123 length:744 start_codon:yes stop_codon:yes gene_type:complete
MDFEHKLAYEIGIKKAREHYMEKQANPWALAKGVGSGLKWLAGFGSGGAASKALGGATGYGLMGLASSEGKLTDFSRQGIENKLKGFAGGFAGGLAFGGANALATRGLRGLNRSFSAGAKGLSKETQTLAKTLDKQKAEIAKLNRQQGFRGAKNTSDATKDKLKGIQDSYKQNNQAYKELLKSQNVGMGTRFNEAVMRNRGTILGVGAGMGGGMYASGLVQGKFDDMQRPILSSQNNYFNPVGNFRS